MLRTFPSTWDSEKILCGRVVELDPVTLKSGEEPPKTGTATAFLIWSNGEKSRATEYQAGPDGFLIAKFADLACDVDSKEWATEFPNS